MSEHSESQINRNIVPLKAANDDAPEPVPIRSRDDFVRCLTDRRRALGLTCLEIDQIAGFHDGYTAHLEHPETRTGRGSLRLTEMGLIWLDTLGLKLQLVQSQFPIRTK